MLSLVYILLYLEHGDENSEKLAFEGLAVRYFTARCLVWALGNAMLCYAMLPHL